MVSAVPVVQQARGNELELPRWRLRLRRARRAAAWFAGAAALLSAAVLLFGWALDVQVVRRLPGYPGMAVSAAAGVLVCALLLLRRLSRSGARSRRYDGPLAAILLGVAVIDLILLSLDPDFGVDAALFGFTDGRAEIYMSPATALCLALASLCLLLPQRGRLFRRWSVGLLTAVGIVLTAFAMAGYLFDSAALRDVFFFAAMSPQTALAFLLLFLALATSQQARGWLPILLGPLPGSATLRRTLPFVVVGPFAVCWLALFAVERGIFNVNFRLSLMAIGAATGLVVLLFWSARRENAAERELMESNRRLRATLAERDVLLKEVYHRVKNNLQFFDAMLALEANGLSGEVGEAKERLAAIRKRVHALSLVHQQLISARDLATLDLQRFLEDLCANLAQGTGLDERGVRLATSIESVPVSLERAVPIGLLVTELFLNAAKHAFPDGRTGTISVEAGARDGGLTLRVCDDGVGRNATAGDGSQVGNLILGSLVAQLKGRMQAEDRKGLQVTIQIPPLPA